MNTPNHKKKRLEFSHAQKTRKIAVVVPAFNEENLLEMTLRGIPSYISWVIVVDDSSTDRSFEVATKCALIDSRIEVLRFGFNQGVGRAITMGYRRAHSLGAEIAVVMAGDNQMDPKDLPSLVLPILKEEADYVKGNRLLHSEISEMPKSRKWGTKILARMTRNLAGLEVLNDSQCGYTAIRTSILKYLEIDSLYPRYGYPNDIIIRISKSGYKISEVSVRPVYAEEVSGFKPYQVIFPILGILWRAKMRRVDIKDRG